MFRDLFLKRVSFHDVTDSHPTTATPQILVVDDSS